MGKYIFGFIAIALLKISVAQQYHPMPTENVVWREYTREILGSSHSISRDFQYYMSGDTLISGKIYHKLYKSGRNYSYYWGGKDSTDYADLYVGAIREDSVKRVYLFDTSEVLLYDFNLDIGDTITAMYGAVGNYTYIVDEIDSVSVTGVFHKRFKIVYGDPQAVLYLIEGVGASTGLLSQFYGSYSWAYISELICFKENNLDSYPDGVSCSLVDVIIPVQKIQIYPNPSKGLIYFRGPSMDSISLSIYNLVGEIVYEKQNLDFYEAIDLRFLSKGVFYLKIQSENKLMTVEKIILE